MASTLMSSRSSSPSRLKSSSSSLSVTPAVSQSELASLQPLRMPARFELGAPDESESVEPCLEGSLTAPIASSEMRPRFFTTSEAIAHRWTGGKRATPLVHHQRPSFVRQHTVSGSNSGHSFPHLVTRAISRTYTLTSNASSSIATEEWRQVFDKFDYESDGRRDGKIPMSKFREILEEDPLWSATVPAEMQEHIFSTVDKNGDGVVDYNEFLELVRGRELGLGKLRRRVLRQLIKQTVEMIVPYKYSYQNMYSCSPPPMLMLSISLAQSAIFAYNSYAMYLETGSIGLNGPVPYCSRLIYDPDRRDEVWRYLSYSLIHAGFFHVCFNVLVQLILAIPLEMVHGWWRVMLVYISGVLAGSLWTSLVNPRVFLSGASGGVYALITAHVGTVIMNYREMTYPWCRVLVVFLVAITDVLVFVYDMLMSEDQGATKTPISYPAHVAGAITGLLVGICCLKNLKWEPHEKIIWAISSLTFAAMLLVTLIYNLAVPEHFTGASVKVGCISNRVL